MEMVKEMGIRECLEYRREWEKETHGFLSPVPGSGKLGKKGYELGEGQLEVSLFLLCNKSVWWGGNVQQQRCWVLSWHATWGYMLLVSSHVCSHGSGAGGKATLSGVPPAWLSNPRHEPAAAPGPSNKAGLFGAGGSSILPGSQTKAGRWHGEQACTTTTMGKQEGSRLRSLQSAPGSLGLPLKWQVGTPNGLVWDQGTHGWKGGLYKVGGKHLTRTRLG